MKIKYDSGNDMFEIDRTPGDQAQVCTVRVRPSMIEDESDVPILLADHAHRHPDKWWDLESIRSIKAAMDTNTGRPERVSIAEEEFACLQLLRRLRNRSVRDDGQCSTKQALLYAELSLVHIQRRKQEIEKEASSGTI